MEHRWGERIQVDIRVRLSCLPYAIGTGRLRDVSVSGAFLETKLQTPLLAHVHVEIDFPSRQRSKRRSLAAHIMRRDENGIGIEWIELAPRAVIKLLEAQILVLDEQESRGEQIRNQCPTG